MDVGHRRFTTQAAWKKGPIVAQLVTHIPDCVVHLDHSKKLPHFDRFDGVVFFADVSGFTSLCEKYTMSGAKSGIDQLTKTLNGYIGALVDRILSADGDVLEYAGDAILAIWTVKDLDHLPGAIYRAIKCALSIQRNFNAWETDVGVTLRVKIGIAAGEICIQYQGHDEFRHYTATGKAVEDVNTAETYCQSGYIVVSPHAWGMCTEKITKDVIHETVQDGRHVRVWEGFGGHSSGYNIKRTIKPNEAQKEVKNKNLGEKLKKLLQDAEQYSGSGLMNIAPRCEYGNKLRQSLLVPDDEVLKSKLKLYIVKPVIKKLDDDQPLEYLSEVREVTIMFTNLSLNDRMTHEEMSVVLQESFEIVYGVCAPLNGCLNKIFAFDKDAKALNFLTIFGLPGFKHENDSQHALQAASQVHAACLLMNHVEAVSIGVTTGATFCGVIGHKHRQEYTVIGRKVNMAARFMMHYPKRVVCDKETFYNSKLGKSQFNEMGDKALKGLQNVGTVREYIGSGDVATGSQRKYRKFFYPLLSRKKEVQTIRRQILWKRDGGDEVPPGMSDIIIIEGEAGVGKTRLLCDILSYADKEQKIGVFFCQCTINSKRIPYFTARSLLAEMLKLDMTAHYQERELVLLEMFSGQEIKDALFLLNDIFHVKFPIVEDAVYNIRENGILDLIERIVYEASSKYGFMLFTVDDAFYMDKESSMFLVPLCMSAVSMVIMTKRPSKGASDPFLAECLQIMPKEARKVSVISIGGLEPGCLSSLACQMLGVKGIPRLLAEILVTKSNGVPQWCEELLREMISDNLIEIVPATEKNLNDKNMVKPSHDDLLPNANADAAASSTVGSKGSIGTNKPKVCIIDPLNNEKIKAIQIPESVKALILARIDQMNPTDQLTVKCASILGQSFQPDLLEAVIPSKEKKDTQLSVTRLIKNGVFACGANVDKSLNGERGSGLPVKNQCYCTLDKQAQEDFSQCRTLVFSSATMQETAYEILLEDQRVLLHRLAAVFLETKAFKCKYCGGGDIMPYRSRALSVSVETELTDEEKQELFKSDVGVSRTQHSQKMKSRGRLMSSVHGEGTFSKSPTMSAQKLLNSKTRVAPIVEAEEDDADTTTLKKEKTKDTLGADFKQQQSRRKSCIQDFLGLPHKEKLVVSAEEENNLLSDFDQRECNCSSVLRYVYPELTRHWKCAGDARNTVYALCHAAAAEIGVHELTQALAYLEEVENIMDMLKEGQNPFERYVSQPSNVNLSKNAYAVFFMFKGQANAQLGKSFQAEKCFRKALKLWKKSQPSNALSCSITIAIEKFKQHLQRKNPTSSRIQPVEVNSGASDQLVHNDIVKCLHDLYQIHMIHQNFRSAFAVALQQLNVVEKSVQSLSSLVSAYTCVIEVSTALGKNDLATTYQNIALNRINDFIDELTPDDVLSISCLHSIMMQAFFNRGKLEEACDAGQNVIRITQRIHAPEVVLHVLPSLAEALLLRMENVGCVRGLENIQVIAEELRDKIGLTWYYVGCINLVLYTGHILEDPEVCNEFFAETWSHPSLTPERILKFHVAISMCLWYTRTGSIFKAESWYSRAEEVMPTMETFRTFMGSLAYSKVVECQLLRLSQFSTSSSRPDLIEWKVQLKDVMKTFIKICKHIEVIQPRRLLLEAFAHGISGNDKAMRSSLAACIAKAEQLNVTFDKAWAEHNQKVWESENIVQVPFWQRRWGRDPALDGPLAGEDEEVATGVNVHFTLPLPEWFSQVSLIGRDMHL